MILSSWGYIPPPVSYVMTSLVGKALTDALIKSDASWGGDGVSFGVFLDPLKGS